MILRLEMLLLVASYERKNIIFMEKIKTYEKSYFKSSFS